MGPGVGGTRTWVTESPRARAEAEAASVRAYLVEFTRMADSDGAFEVVAHIDYLTRQIDQAGRVHYPRPFEGEYRLALRALAGSGRVLEINSRLPLDPTLVGWWHEEGGEAVSFGSDAHTPEAVGRGFADAAAAGARNVNGRSLLHFEAEGEHAAAGVTAGMSAQLTNMFLPDTTSCGGFQPVSPSTEYQSVVPASSGSIQLRRFICCLARTSRRGTILSARSGRCCKN